MSLGDKYKYHCFFWYISEDDAFRYLSHFSTKDMPMGYFGK